MKAIITKEKHNWDISKYNEAQKIVIKLRKQLDEYTGIHHVADQSTVLEVKFFEVLHLIEFVEDHAQDMIQMIRVFREMNKLHFENR